MAESDAKILNLPLRADSRHKRYFRQNYCIVIGCIVSISKWLDWVIFKKV